MLKGPSKGGYNPSPATVEVILAEDCVATATAGERSVTVGLPPDGTIRHLRPTELILAGLGGCILANVIVSCRERNLNWQGVRLVLTNADQMSPPRISSIQVAIHLKEIPVGAASELIQYVRENSRMYNTLSSQVSVALTVVE